MGLKNLFSRKREIKKENINISNNEKLTLLKSLDSLQTRLNDIESRCQNAKSAEGIQYLKDMLVRAKNCRFRSFSDCQSILNLVDRELTNLSFILNHNDNYIYQQVLFIARLLDDFPVGRTIYLENKDIYKTLLQRSKVYDYLVKNIAELDKLKQERKWIAKAILEAKEKNNNIEVVTLNEKLRTITNKMIYLNGQKDSQQKDLDAFNAMVDATLEEYSARAQSELVGSTSDKIAKSIEQTDKITYQNEKKNEKAREAILKSRTKIMDRYTSDEKSISGAMNEAVEQSSMYGKVQAQKDNSLLNDDMASDIDFDMLNRIANGEDE